MSILDKSIDELIYDDVEDTEEYRDSIATVDGEGNRNWIFPRKPKGKYYDRRKWVSYFLLVLFFATPFIKINGNPFLLINILERKFVIFGMPFWPQDFHLFVLAMISFFVFIILFTVAFGRLWCGWACPQTLFMEMVFRRIEYWIEGDASTQRKLSKATWSASKIQKRGLKYLIFFTISFLISNTVLAYIFGIEVVMDMVTSSPASNWGRFGGMMAFATVFFFVFAWLREQACIIICPYGRLQGVLLNNNSISVMYDWIRGEPRGKIKRGKQDPLLQEEKGDCVDCNLCVQVCPTGIDIRNGTQLECINCTACMDACDTVMSKVGKPEGLIRYDSHNGIENKQPFTLNTRIIAYIAALMAVLAVFGMSLASRNAVEATILRTPGVLFQETEDGFIQNVYNIQIVNKTTDSYPVELRLISHEGEIQIIGESLSIDEESIAKGVMLVKIPKEIITQQKNRIELEIWGNDKLLDKTTTSFLGPMVLNYED
ncbi:MAG: cytochrome c oxidase accessory protein CcoG [Bacteroidia bacterium]|nr:cytochrome c oxidase accessory protein CcoG [Bacteroidia bacterium]